MTNQHQQVTVRCWAFHCSQPSHRTNSHRRILPSQLTSGWAQTLSPRPKTPQKWPVSDVAYLYLLQLLVPFQVLSVCVAAATAQNKEPGENQRKHAHAHTVYSCWGELQCFKAWRVTGTIVGVIRAKIDIGNVQIYFIQTSHKRSHTHNYVCKNVYIHIVLPLDFTAGGEVKQRKDEIWD